MPCLIESIIANSDLMKYWKMAPQHCLQSSLSTWNRFNGIKKINNPELYINGLTKAVKTKTVSSNFKLSKTFF